MLDERLIRCGVKAKDKEEVIKLLGDLLLKYGYVKESYTQAVIDREKVFPTGLEMPGNGYNVAIPHTDAVHVNKPAMAIAVLDSPVTFTHMATDDQPVPVDLVFALALNDPQQVVAFLKDLINALQDHDLRKNLKEASSPSQIVELLSKYI